MLKLFSLYIAILIKFFFVDAFANLCDFNAIDKLIPEIVVINKIQSLEGTQNPLLVTIEGDATATKWIAKKNVFYRSLNTHSAFNEYLAYLTFDSLIDEIAKNATAPNLRIHYPIVRLVRVKVLELDDDAYDFYSLQKWVDNATSDPWLISKEDSINKFPLSDFAASFDFVYLWDFLIGNEDRFFSFEIQENPLEELKLKLKFDNLIATNNESNNTLILSDQGRAWANSDGKNFLKTNLTTAGSLGQNWNEWIARIGTNQFTSSGLVSRCREMIKPFVDRAFHIS